MNHVVLKSKTKVLSEVLMATKSIYDDANKEQKALLETLIGAAIWYLPSSAELYSGKISKAAYDLIKQGDYPKLVEEHSYPRKIAGRFLYENAGKLIDNPDFLADKYKELFGRFNLVLKNENDRLKPFQKVDSFIDEKDAYERAGLQLEDFSKESYKEYKKNMARNSRGIQGL